MSTTRPPMPGKVTLAVMGLWLHALAVGAIAATSLWAAIGPATSDARPRSSPDNLVSPSTMYAEVMLRQLALEVSKVTMPLFVVLAVCAGLVLVRATWARWVAVGGELSLLVVALLALHNGLDNGNGSGIVIASALVVSVAVVLRMLQGPAAVAYYRGGSSPERMSSASTMR